MSQSPEAMKVWKEAQSVFDEHPEGPFADTDAADLAAASVIEAALQKARDEEREKAAAIMELLAEAQNELRHSSVFVRSRERMHPAGLALYDELLERIIAFRRDHYLSALAEEDGKEL